MATQAYIDTTDRTLTVVTYRNETVTTIDAPDNILNGSDFAKRNWVAQAVSPHGYKVATYASGTNEFRTYPYGQYINLNRTPGQSFAARK